MTILITLTTAGSDTGPFNLYSDTDGYISAFETGVLKSDLLAGYISYLVPDGTNSIRVMSDGTCLNFVDISITFTTTTTTTIPNPLTSTLTFTSYEEGRFRFDLSDPIYTTDLIIDVAGVDGAEDDSCGAVDASDTISGSNPLTILAGSTNGTSFGNTPMSCDIISMKRHTSINVDGYGTFFNTQTFDADGTTVTVSISNSCINPYTCSTYSTQLAKYSTSVEVICAATPTAIYTTFPQTITTGIIIYTDSGLTTPLTGYDYIVANDITKAIHHIDSLTGVVGAATIVFCS